MKKLTIDGVTTDTDTIIESYKRLSTFANVNERDRVIFEEKFGIKDGRIKTYVEVGKKFNISGNRAAQLCARLLFRSGILS